VRVNISTAVLSKLEVFWECIAVFCSQILTFRSIGSPPFSGSTSPTFTLKMEALRYLRRAVPFYQSIRRKHSIRLERSIGVLVETEFVFTIFGDFHSVSIQIFCRSVTDI
jgi:hypothetical protein